MSQVLESLLVPLDIRYKNINKQIVLTKNSGAQNDEASAAPESSAPTKALQIIRGVVRDNLGDILPGVSILIKGSQRGTVSDADGKFEIDLADGESLLIFSYVGYISQEVLVGSQTELEVTLGADIRLIMQLFEGNY